jgi:acyl carrier protein
MDKEQIRTIVMEILSSHFHSPELLRDESTMDYLGFDSIDIQELLTEIEARFGIEIPQDQQIQWTTTISLVVELVDGLINEHHNPT